MEEFMIQFINMSIQTAWIVCVILLVRMILIKMNIPRKYIQILWIIPYFRMIIPWQMKSRFSLMPDERIMLNHNKLIGAEGMLSRGPEVNAGSLGEGIGDDAFYSISRGQVAMLVFAVAWVTIAALLILYGIISYGNLKKKLSCRILKEENIYYADHITTPFVFGIFRPAIYLPSDMQEHDLAYVIAHEQIHIRRKDYLVKILTYGITCIHWFNPLAWIAFICLGRDMEISCDDAVIHKLGTECRQAYAEELLAFSAADHSMLHVPLAFGEENPKHRILNIMNQKKPVLICGILAVILILAVFVGLMTGRKTVSESEGDHPAENLTESTEIIPDTVETSTENDGLQDMETGNEKNVAVVDGNAENEYMELDFANDRVIIFHSSAISYLYSIADQALVCQVDLESGEVTYYTDDKENCQVYLYMDEESGLPKYVDYLFGKWDYQYNIEEKSVTEPLSSTYPDTALLNTDECVEPDHTVYRSRYCMKTEENGEDRYLYLESGSGMMEDLQYVIEEDGERKETGYIFQIEN